MHTYPRSLGELRRLYGTCASLYNEHGWVATASY